MNGTWGEEQLIADGFERVTVELEWYDGLRAGLAGVGGEPHYFDGYGQYTGDGPGEYRVWPAPPAAVAWEHEQWAIRLRWSGQRGEGAPDPALGGVDARYDELDALLAGHRQEPPDARLLAGEVRHTGAGDGPEGTGYWVRWRLHC
ncbi:hypothetical protein [Kitasatospora sp. NPDC057198]|uniref:hypothetical protein n=1 Tax=Kitasatospora sp. NPDC057198 TaxID=3346046 RepID=UPI0036324EBE